MSLSFAVGTWISCARGSWLPIEQLKPGDLVCGMDIAPGDLAPRVVRQIDVTDPADCCTISRAGTEITCSPDASPWCASRTRYVHPRTFGIGLLGIGGVVRLGFGSASMTRRPMVRVWMEDGENLFVGGLSGVLFKA